LDDYLLDLQREALREWSVIDLAISSRDSRILLVPMLILKQDKSDGKISKHY
jgi:hypothetical protein